MPDTPIHLEILERKGFNVMGFSPKRKYIIIKPLFSFWVMIIHEKLIYDPIPEATVQCLPLSFLVYSDNVRLGNGHVVPYR